ncbi:putative PPPDE thiol peptidase family protein, partial [Trifolium medium]|nr:putative PPPDE thiol peptidase family protein [Trifolium medium]
GKMKLKSKKGWKSIVPLHLKGKSSVTRFSLFRKVNSASHGPGKTPVYLNVYDLTPMNGYVYWAGFGIYHSGVEGMVLGSNVLNFDHTLPLNLGT